MALADEGLTAFLRQFSRTMASTSVEDGQLLERFVRRGDGEAFSLLVRRHGPMVWGVCRRILGQVHDAEDAFQATFFLLARKAGRLRQPNLLGAWLHGVARRIALKARARAGRRSFQQIEDVAAPTADNDLTWHDLRPVLDEAIGLLPAKYQRPFVLCYLEGMTNAQAAQQLGCPQGTVVTWLARARKHLCASLSRRGLAPTAGLLAAGLAQEAQATVPTRLLVATSEAAATLGATHEGTLVASGTTLTAGVWRTMSTHPLKSLAGVLLLIGLAGSGALLAHRGEAVEAAGDEKQPAPSFPAPAAAPDKPATRVAQAPQKVEPGELAGVVVGENGEPLEGVHVHVWDWYPGREATTAKDGIFRIKDLGRDSKVQVRFRKPGYSPEMFLKQPTGVPGLVVTLDRKTYFEGVVRRPDGKPAPEALIRANQGPKQIDGGIMSTIWTETTTDAKGRYRLYVQPDQYEFHVKAKGVGVARLPKTGIGHAEVKPLDIDLQVGLTFRAKVVDSQSDKPVPGVRLWHWQHKDVEGRSNAQGEVAITEMLPGRFDFQIEAKGYTRWWSPEAANEFERYKIDKPEIGWQRNFDDLGFDLKPDLKVRIVVEKGVRVLGRVFDPDGLPVAGATVAPALTSTGNSLTGDTRFSVETSRSGRFEMLLPASGAAVYNLVAHDGKYGEWRKWANGVLAPIQTKPGQEIKDVKITLTRPATVRGRVLDKRGKPIAYCEVRAHAADKRENRYYDPTTTTREDGTFELRFVRPGEHFIQVYPFWLTAEEAPGGSTQRLKLAAGETVKDVELTGEDLPP
jgi:RNA polymerase sigma factor (sigma-70 family)